MSQQDRELDKVLSRFDMLVLAFGAMIGWGWVVLSGKWILTAGSIGSLVAFALGGLLVVFIGLTFAELAAAIPKEGGELHFAHRAMGKSVSFFTSWAVVLGYFSVAAFEAVALPTVIGYLFPHFQWGYLWSISGWDVYASWALIGIGGAVLMTALNYFGIKTAAIVQVILTVVIFTVGMLLFFGASFGHSSTSNLQPLFDDGAAGIMSVLIMTPFMFVGFGVIPQAAGEARIKPRAIGRIMVFSVICAIAFYLLVIYGVGLVLDPAALKQTQLATADAMGVAYGSPLFAKILILGGVAGILTSWNGFIIGASRMLYAMSQHQMLPPWFNKVHPKYKTPSTAILVIGFFSMLSPLLGRPMLLWLVNAGSLSINIAWFMVALSFVVLRYREPQMPRPYRAGRSAIVGWSALVLAIIVGLLYVPGMPASLGWPFEWGIFLAWWLIGLAFFLHMKSGRNTAATALGNTPD